MKFLVFGKSGMPKGGDDGLAGKSILMGLNCLFFGYMETNTNMLARVLSCYGAFVSLGDRKSAGAR